MPSIARIEELAQEFTRIRREFHAHPELSNQEFETSKKIAQYLTQWGIEVHTGIGGTGVVGVLKNGNGTKRIALRADMDALPVTEANHFEHASKIPASCTPVATMVISRDFCWLPVIFLKRKTSTVRSFLFSNPVKKADSALNI